MMMNKNPLWAGVSMLIVAVVAIMAFVRGNAQVWLLTAVFGVWAIWATVRFLVPYIKAKVYHYQARKLRKEYEAKKPEKEENISPDISEQTGIVLLRHVNFRISAYLQSAYPDATWEWREEFPERIAAKGGTGRIELFGIPDFNFADITFDQSAGINCALLKIVPLSKLQGTANTADTETKAANEEPPKKANPVDPQVWYEMQGRKVLKELIADLNSRGHHSLTVKETGEISIQQSDKEIVKAAFENVPDKVYWPRLTRVFESEGLTAAVNAGGIVLSW